MNLIKICAVFLVTFYVSGCVTTVKERISREELSVAQDHTIANSTSEDVLNAAKQVFQLMDGDDFEFSQTDDTLYATREYVFFIIISLKQGKENWRITAKQSGSNVEARAFVRAFGGEVTTYGNHMSKTRDVESPLTYEIFWERVNFLLGKSTVWPTCDMARERAKAFKNILQRRLSAICNRTIDDNVPKSVGS